MGEADLGGGIVPQQDGATKTVPDDVEAFAESAAIHDQSIEVGAAIDKLHKEMAASIGAALIMIFVAVVFAKISVAITGLNLDATVLSYAPGGFAEMSLIGLALGIEVAMVATHHLFRLFLILLTSPLIFRFWRPYS